MPTELIRRLGIGIAVAVIGAAALWIWLARDEARADERWRRDSRDAPSQLERMSQVVLPRAMPRGVCRTLTLATAELRIARDVAPVIEIRRGGSVRLVRGPPAPSGPGATGPWDAGIVLPRPDVGDLEPRERAALLEILRTWGGSASIGVDRLRLVDVLFRPGDWDELTRWRR